MSTARANSLEKESLPPRITKSMWIRLINEGDLENFIEIKEAMPESFVRVRLSVRGLDSGNINIIIFDDNEEIEETTLSATVQDGVAVSGELKIKGDWIDKKIKIKVETQEIFEEEHIGPELKIIPIEFAEIKIKTLDCRSGNGVRNSRISKIKIKTGDIQTQAEDSAYDFIESFERDSKKKDYNTSNDIIKASMEVLKLLDSSITDAVPTDNKYNAAWRGHYNSYWNRRVSKDFSSLTEGNPSETMMKHIIDHYNNHRITDNNGLLKIYIPKPLLDDKRLKVELGFYDFPVVLERLSGQERTIVRSSETLGANGTGFAVTWEGQQDINWGGNFGWMLRNGDDSSELKVSESLVIKNDENKFVQLVTNLLSSFYEDDKPHFVLFAMQWCQPVWDEVDDPNPDAANSVRSNEYAFVNMKQGNNWVKGLNMHIPSKHSGSSGPYYGIFDISKPFPRGKKHEGVDLYSGPNGNNPAFAVHCGQIKAHSGSDYGYRAYLLFGGIGDPCFHYAHLEQPVTAKAWVMAGEKIAISSLTRNIENNAPTYFTDEPYHLHLEFIASPTGTTTPIAGTKSDFSEIANINPPATASYERPTGANAFLFQGNRLPLLLPCKSVYCNHPNAPSIKNCNVANTTNTSTNYKTCYAIQKYPYTSNLLLSDISDMVSSELHPATGLIRYICPHILGANTNKKVQLQAKIKFLHINKDRFNPGIFTYQDSEQTTFNAFFTDHSGLGIDGDPGDKTRKAIRELVRAYYYCSNSDKTEAERTLKTNNTDDTKRDTKIKDAKIKAFIDKYVDGTAISSDDEYSVINNFYDWFTNESQVDFSKMCWNAPL